MTGRDRRRNAQPNAAMYVGYADDDEDVESIMAKFQAIEDAKGAKGGGKLPAPKQSPEELLDAGKIDIAEYRRLIALPPEPTPPSERGGGASQRGLRGLGALEHDAALAHRRRFARAFDRGPDHLELLASEQPPPPRHAD